MPTWTTPRDWTDGEFVIESMLDTHIRDNLMLVPHRIPKTANQSVTSSTALVDDTHLQFAIGANEAWEFNILLSVTGPGFIKTALNAPSGATGWWGAAGTAGSYNYIGTALFTDAQTNGGSADPDRRAIEGFVLNGGTGGTFKLRWAQTNSSGTSTVVLQGSRLERRKV